MTGRDAGRLACPCCGYRTLASGPGDYEVCAVCGWEDDGLPPWTVGGPNGGSLVEAQLRYLSEGRARRRMRHLRGWGRRPRPGEERGPGWRPLAAPDELLARADRERRAEEARVAALDPGPSAEDEDALEAYNAAVAVLREGAGALPYAVVAERFEELSVAHGWRFPPAELELLSRELRDEHWRLRHPVAALGWFWRHRRTAPLRVRLRQLLTGRFRTVG